MKLGLLAGVAGIALAAMTAAASAQGTLRIAMTAADIPKTHGQPDQGFEGNRFTGIPMYDGLTAWDLSSADKPSVVIPGLATEWSVDASDKTKWVFKLRPGVKFHDGSAFDADAVVWNVEKVLKQDAAHFDASQVGVTASRMPTLRSARKIDALTVELTTSQPDSFLPINLTNLFMASPAHWQKLFDAAQGADAKAKAAAAWTAFAANASGTGPFRMERFVPRERLEVVRNADYWDKPRVPKLDRVVMLPMPEANTRTAALLSGQVDWIEAPAPDAVAQLKQRGMVITANAQPHVWPWQFSFVEGSPFADRRVRQAANLCVNRGEMKELLAGLMEPAKGTVPPGHPWWGNPKFDIKYDPDAARKLMGEAGFSKAKPLTVKIQTSASGSGQMMPLPMNELMQQNLADCFFKATSTSSSGTRCSPTGGAAPRTRRRAARTPSTSPTRRWTRSSPWPASSTRRWRRRSRTTGASSTTPSSTSWSPRRARPSRPARATPRSRSSMRARSTRPCSCGSPMTWARAR